MAKYIKEIARKLEDGSYEKVSLGATNVSELNNDSGFITAADLPVDAVVIPFAEQYHIAADEKIGEEYCRALMECFDENDNLIRDIYISIPKDSENLLSLNSYQNEGTDSSGNNTKVLDFSILYDNDGVLFIVVQVTLITDANKENVAITMEIKSQTGLQRKLTFDKVPTEGSHYNPVTSDGIKTYVDNAVPTKLSVLTNDSGFITNTVTNLTNYYTKSETYTQDEVKALIDAITTLNIEVVAELPTTNISATTIYLKGSETTGTNDYEEWIYANNDWELIGTTAIDLSNYATKDYIQEELIVSQADWNENDPTAASYVKNRTHYEGGLVKTQWFSSPITSNEWRDYTSDYDSALAAGLKILFFDDNYSLDDSGQLEIDKNQYYFSIDGKDYVLPFTTEPPYDIYLGIPWKDYGEEWDASSFENQQCPISIYFHRASGTSGPQLYICYNPEYVDLTNSILEIGYAETGIVTIDKKFLGLDKINLSELNNDTGFITKDVKDLVAYYDVSETYNKEEIDNFLYEYYTKNEIDDKNFADGDVYKNNQILMGAYFPATYNEGNIAAFGVSTHPYGYGTTTMGYASSAHGYGATAMGQGATATGDYSVAMGDRTETVGEGAFTAGSMTRAEGRYSIAVGQESIASSDYSHAEGLGTIASRVGQHTEGMYNISEEIVNEDDIYYTGNLLHIIGNGNSDSERSNAYTLDIEGNAWFSGDVYIGSTSGTNKDEGSKKLAIEENHYTKTEIDNMLSSAGGGSELNLVDPQPYEEII